MAEQRNKSTSSRVGANPTTYDDIFMRKNLNDTGTLPVTNPDWWTCSPDIIPNGVDVLSDPVTYLTQTYDKEVGKDTVIQRQNYFYVRGKNSYNGDRKGDFYLYYCPGHLFLFPSLWVDNQLKTSSGKDFVSATVKQNEIAVPNEPFIYKPESEEHSCLVARVVTEGNPNPLPDDFADMGTLAKYIVEHPNIAWRNVSLVNKDIPTFTRTFQLDSGDTEGAAILGIRCHNISDGSRIAFSCGTPIPSGPDAGKHITMSETVVVNPPDALDPLYLLRIYLPAGFKTTISYSYWAKTPIKPEWKVFFEGYYVANQDNELYEHCHELKHYGININKVKNSGMMKESTMMPRIIRIGSVQVNGV
ncbi:MAG: hypothetical protein WBN94_00545 [Methanothrix sp.]